MLIIGKVCLIVPIRQIPLWQTSHLGGNLQPNCLVAFLGYAYAKMVELCFINSWNQRGAISWEKLLRTNNILKDEVWLRLVRMRSGSHPFQTQLSGLHPPSRASSQHRPSRPLLHPAVKHPLSLLSSSLPRRRFHRTRCRLHQGEGTVSNARPFPYTDH